MTDSFDMYGWRRKFNLMAEVDNDPTAIQDFDPELHGKITGYSGADLVPSEDAPETINFKVNTEKDKDNVKVIIVPYADFENFIDVYDAENDCRLDDNDQYMMRFFENLHTDQLSEEAALEFQKQIYKEEEAKDLEEDLDELKVETPIDSSYTFEYFMEDQDTLAMQVSDWVDANRPAIEMYMDLENYEDVANMLKQDFPSEDEDILINLVNRMM